MRKLLFCISLTLAFILCFTGCDKDNTTVSSNVSDTVTASSNISDTVTASSQVQENSSPKGETSLKTPSAGTGSKNSLPVPSDSSRYTSSNTVPKDDFSMINVDTNGKKLVAFTFDDGPNSYGSELLNTFRENGGHCTFFVIGKKVTSTYEDFLENCISSGMQIGNHSYSHTKMTTLSETQIIDDFKKGHDAVKKLIGYEMTIARLPELASNSTVFSAMKSLGLPCISGSGTKGSSVGSLRDYNSSFSAEEIEICIEESIYDGAIFVCHSVKNTSAAMKVLLPELKKQGYAFVTVDEMMKLKGQTTMPFDCQIRDGLLNTK